MRAFERYEGYKNSNIEWIGDIPSHWLMRKVSRSFSTIGSGTTPSSGNESYYKDGQILWINSGDLNNGYINDSEKKVNQNALNDFSALKIYKEGSLIVAMYGATIGKLGILKSEASVNQACCVLNDSEYFEIKFVFYWFLANKQNIVNLSFGGGQPNISQDVIKNLKIQAPPLEEQKQIADFLDIKSKQIDEFIADKQALIALFEEQKSAVTGEAVTKGLNKTAPLKPSGIEWLGDIPSHWEARRIKFVTNSVKTGSTPETKKGNFFEGGFFDWFTPTDFNSSLILQDSDRKVNQQALEQDEIKIFEKNTVCMIGIGATVGKVGMMSAKGSCNQQINTISFNELVYPEYGLYYLYLTGKEIQKFANTVTLPIFNQGDTKDLTMPLPPLEEQKQIVEYLEKELSKIDTLIETAKAEITLIEEYKTSLINEVVTGKIKI